ncbi:MAG: peptidase S8 [Flavobacteriaceae bacterium]|nr:peptidase S8 [Flavobacteriaceae bacterium]
MEYLHSSLENVKGASVNIPGQYIVVYNTTVTGDLGAGRTSHQAANDAVVALTNAILGSSRQAENEILHVYSKSINGVTLRLNKKQVAMLENDSRVAFIEQDRIVQFAPPCGTPNGGPCEPGGGGGGGSEQETPWGITRVNGVSNYTGSGVAWILDSGIDLEHSDLVVDASRGFTAFTSGRDASMDDLNGHGSHVAGTIAAKNNSFGVIGVAPGATVIPVKVLDRRGSGSYSGVIAGVDHVGANGNSGDVANMSLGGPISTALEAAISNAAGAIKFCLAAGNESQNTNNVSPGRLNGNGIYTISAMSQGDNWASFSNFANPPIDYCAPGVSVKSTWKKGGYNTISGTSMATPHAAGVFLLGNASTDGTVNGDPDGNADPIIVH